MELQTANTIVIPCPRDWNRDGAAVLGNYTAEVESKSLL